MFIFDLLPGMLDFWIFCSFGEIIFETKLQKI